MMCDLLRVGEKDHIMDLWLLSLLFFRDLWLFSNANNQTRRKLLA